MLEEASPAPSVIPVSPPSWPRIWWNALVRPTVATYQALASDPRASSQQAYRWVVRTAVVAGLLLGLVQYGGNLGAICLGPIFAALLSLGSFALVAGGSHGVARALGGTGTYAQLAYAIAAYFVPLSLLTTGVGAIAAISFPSFGMLNIALWLYGLLLNTVATKAVHQLSWGRAALPSIILAGLGAVLFVGLVIIQVALALQQPGP